LVLLVRCRCCNWPAESRRAHLQARLSNNIFVIGFTPISYFF